MKTFILTLTLALFTQITTAAETPAPMAASKAALEAGTEKINMAAQAANTQINAATASLAGAWEAWKIQTVEKVQRATESADKEIAAVITAASDYKSAELKTGTAAVVTVTKVATKILQPTKP